MSPSFRTDGVGGQVEQGDTGEEGAVRVGTGSDLREGP